MAKIAADIRGRRAGLQCSDDPLFGVSNFSTSVFVEYGGYPILEEFQELESFVPSLVGFLYRVRQ